MSSTFGGSAGGGNRVVYIVTVDSSGVSQGLQTAEQAFNRFNTAAQSTARNLQSFDAPLGQLNTGFQGIGTGVDSASTSFNSLDNSLQTTSQNIKTTTTDLDAINSNWQQMGSGADSASNSVDALGNSFNAAKGGLTEYNTLSGTVVTNTQNMGDATQTMGDKMRSAGSFVKEHGLALALVTSSVVNLVSSYTQLQKSQLAADRASVMSEKANQRVVKAQDALNKAVEKFGPNSHEAQVKAKDLELAQDAAGVAMRKAALALQTLAQQQASFVPQLIQDMVLIGGGTANMVSGIKDAVPAIRGFATALKTGLAPALLAAAGPVLVAVVGIYALIGALTAAAKLNELVAQKMKAAGKDAVFMSVSEAKLIETKKALGLATKEEIAKLDKFNSQMENNVITSDEYKKVLEDSFNPTKMLDNITGEVTKSLDKFRTAQATATETTDEATVSTEAVAKASNTARMGIDQSASSVNAYVESITKQIDAGDVLAQQQVDALAHIKPYTAEMLKLVGVVLQTSTRFGELNKVQTQFDKTLQTTKSGVTTTADIMKAVNDTLHMTSTNILALDKEMDALATTRAPAVDAAMVKAANDSQAAWKEFADEFNKNTDIISALGIDKKFDSDKIAKNLVKGLPNKLEKRMKLDLTFEEKSRKTEEGIQKFLQGVLNAKPTGGFEWDPDLKINDKSATQIAKDLIKNIDKNTQDADLKQFRDKLKAAVDRGASESDIAKILADHVKNAPPIPVYVVDAPNTVKDFHSIIQDFMNKEPIQVKADFVFPKGPSPDFSGFSGAGFDFSLDGGKNGKTNVSSDRRTSDVGDHGQDYQEREWYWRYRDTLDANKNNQYTGNGGGTNGLSGFDSLFNPVAGFSMGSPDMVTGQVASMLGDFIKKYLGLQLQGDPKLPQLGMLWDDRSLLKPMADMGKKLQFSLSKFGNDYIKLFSQGYFKSIASTKPSITPVDVRPAIQGFNLLINKALGPLAAGIITAVGEETTNMYFGTKTIAQAKASVLSSAATNKKIQQNERSAYSNISSGGIIGAKPPAAGTGVPPIDTSAQVTAVQTLQKAIASLATYGAKYLQALGNAAKTHFNSVANYAKGAITFLQTFQTALQSAVTYGSKNLGALGKAAKTNFNSVANYADGATTFIQTLQIALNSLQKTGITNMKALASASKTNFNTVANYANGATKAINALNTAIGKMQSKSITLTVKRVLTGPSQSTGGVFNFPEQFPQSFARGGISAAGGLTTSSGPTTFTYGDNPGGHETLAFIPHNNPKPILDRIDKMFHRSGEGGGSGSVVNQTVVLHVSGSELINERNLTKRIKLTVGQNRDKYG